MTQQELPSGLKNIVESPQTLDTLFSALLPAVGDFLQSDRCFLYLHNPQNDLGRVAFCWIRTPDVPTVYNEDWAAQPPTLVEEDPMFAAALRAEPSIFVEDVETAAPQVLNREFEQKNFGHRALIHAHIRQDGQLWGILQPCIFGHPRTWTEYERGVINSLVDKITPFAVSYVKSAFNSLVLLTYLLTVLNYVQRFYILQPTLTNGICIPPIRGLRKDGENHNTSLVLIFRHPYL